MSTDAILSQVSTSSTRLVRFLYTDLASIIRGKVTHSDRLKARLEGGIGLVKGMLAFNVLDQMQSDTGFGAVGEVRLVPDTDTFVSLPYAPNTAAVVCDLMELDRTPWALCPRNVLKKQIAKAAEMGIEIQAAFEPEFMLGSENDEGDFFPIDRSPCFSTEGMNRASKFIDQFVDALERQGMNVEQYYPEYGHGQHELSISHAPALQAADRHIFYRETLRGVATNQGLVAMLAPKPFANMVGNGCHLHISAWDATSKKNLFAADDEPLSDTGRYFVAGLLKHLPALVAITCPTVNSYRRLKPKSWSSAFVCWGLENREAAVRIPSTYWDDREGSTNIEIKCVDSSSNPYLALAAAIACGLDGVRRKLQPPEPVEADPSTLTTEEQQLADVKRLPSTLKEALRRLLHDALLMEVLGEQMARTFITVKTSEVIAFAKNSVDYELKEHRTKF